MNLGWDQNKLYHGFPLPSPRQVSNDLISSSKITADDEISHMVMQWGQFLGEIELFRLGRTVGGLKSKKVHFRKATVYGVYIKG